MKRYSLKDMSLDMIETLYYEKDKYLPQGFSVHIQDHSEPYPDVRVVFVHLDSGARFRFIHQFTNRSEIKQLPRMLDNMLPAMNQFVLIMQQLFSKRHWKRYYNEYKIETDFKDNYIISASLYKKGSFNGINMTFNYTKNFKFIKSIRFDTIIQTNQPDLKHVSINGNYTFSIFEQRYPQHSIYQLCLTHVLFYNKKNPFKLENFIVEYAGFDHQLDDLFKSVKH